MNSNLITKGDSNLQLPEIDKQLISYAKDYYGSSFDEAKEKEICSMDTIDKLWLLNQYQEEMSSVSKPNLNDLY
jgi:hypothetical protein